MKITIRKGEKKDLPAVLSLIKELADYENALEEVTITLEDLEKDGFENHPWYWFLLFRLLLSDLGSVGSRTSFFPGAGK